MLEYTSLPNLHPAVVHFPLVLLPLAFGFDLAALRWRTAWLDRVATLLFALTAATGWLALEAGERAADSLIAVPAMAQPAIASHSDSAHYSLYLIAVLAAARLVIWWLDRHRETITRLAWRGLATVATLAGLALLARTADLGGALVYQHGLGVSFTEPAQATRATEPTPRVESDVSDLVAGADGRVRWTPRAPAALTQVEVWGQAPVAQEAPAGEGLLLTALGETWLALPGEFGDVQVDVELAFEGFSGEVGVFFQAADSRNALIWRLTTRGEGDLGSRADGAAKSFDKKTVSLPAGVHTLAASAAGKHFKGLLDGATITHGHAPARPPGRCGLFLRGEGSVRVLALEVLPLS